VSCFSCLTVYSLWAGFSCLCCLIPLTLFLLIVSTLNMYSPLKMCLLHLIQGLYQKLIKHARFSVNITAIYGMPQPYTRHSTFHITLPLVVSVISRWCKKNKKNRKHRPKRLLGQYSRFFPIVTDGAGNETGFPVDSEDLKIHSAYRIWKTFSVYPI